MTRLDGESEGVAATLSKGYNELGKHFIKPLLTRLTVPTRNFFEQVILTLRHVCTKFVARLRLLKGSDSLSLVDESVRHTLLLEECAMNKLRRYIAATVTRHTRHRYITVLCTLLDLVDDHAAVKDDRFWLFSGSASDRVRASGGPDPTQLSTVNKRTCHKTRGCLASVSSM